MPPEEGGKFQVTVSKGEGKAGHGVSQALRAPGPNAQGRTWLAPQRGEESSVVIASRN